MLANACVSRSRSQMPSVPRWARACARRRSFSTKKAAVPAVDLTTQTYGPAMPAPPGTSQPTATHVNSPTSPRVRASRIPNCASCGVVPAAPTSAHACPFSMVAGRRRSAMQTSAGNLTMACGRSRAATWWSSRTALLGCKRPAVRVASCPARLISRPVVKQHAPRLCWDSSATARTLLAPTRLPLYLTRSSRSVLLHPVAQTRRWEAARWTILWTAVWKVAPM